MPSRLPAFLQIILLTDYNLSIFRLLYQAGSSCAVSRVGQRTFLPFARSARFPPTYAFSFLKTGQNNCQESQWKSFVLLLFPQQSSNAQTKSSRRGLVHGYVQEGTYIREGWCRNNGSIRLTRLYTISPDEYSIAWFIANYGPVTLSGSFQNQVKS